LVSKSPARAACGKKDYTSPRDRVGRGRRKTFFNLYVTWGNLEFAMHPVMLFEPSLAAKIVVAAITIVALILSIRSYLRRGKL
jgi:hypothetical protein